MSPASITPIRVARVIASSWSWVTTTKVTPVVFLDLDQLELGLLAQLLVERAERLVEQQQLRPLGQRAGERDALALAAGQLVRLAPAIAFKLDEASISATRALMLGLAGMPSRLRP